VEGICEAHGIRRRGLWSGAGGAVTSLALALFALAAAFAPAWAQIAPTPAPDVRVYDDGPFMLVRYTTDGKQLQRLTGFGTISQLALYDDSTVLVAESDRNRITAVGLDGVVKWSTPVRRPRCVQVLGPDRLLVCQDIPAELVEVDRAGHVQWHVTKPLVDAAGALRLPDGNTAVVEGRYDHHAVRIIDPHGAILWSGTKDLAQPRGLAMLPSGEMITSGFDRPKLVIFTPYSEKVREIFVCCHVEGPTASASGEIIAASPEQQRVQAWGPGGEARWSFETSYPPYGGVQLPDGTVLVSLYRVPDRVCMNAVRAAALAKRPLAPYWRWFLGGIGGALLLIFVLQVPALRSALRGGEAAAVPAGADVPLAGGRRIELAFYVAAAIGLGGAASLVHARLLGTKTVEAWPYFGWIAGAGVFLALLQYRLPRSADDWLQRMARLEPMAPTNARMWLLWAAGLALTGVGLEAIWHLRGAWMGGAWVAGVLLLAGGCLQRPRRFAFSRRELVAALVVGALLLVPRLYQLQYVPANLHHDMAQWTLQAFRLLDGDVPTLFTNGWAEIPMLGYLWTAAVAALGDRSLAATRLEAVAASMLALLAVYFLVRRWYGKWPGLLVVLLLGTHQGFFHFSRIQAYMDPVPFAVLALLGLIAGIETGSYGWFALAGLAGGFSGLTYHAGRITPPVMVLSAVLLLLRYPRAILRRWSGLLLCALILAACLAPQAIVYLSGRANAFGRSDQFVWARTGSIDWALLHQTIAVGLPRVFGSFWFFGDTSTQYGGAIVFYPPVAALLGMFVVAAVLRPHDLRGVLTVLWAAVVLFIGGVLTVDPPFWPRLVIALVPACIAAGAAFCTLARGTRAALGRAGVVLAIAGGVALAALSARDQLSSYWHWATAIPPGHTQPVRSTQWVQGIMGRDVQTWGPNAMVYIVARNQNTDSCSHPAMQYYDAAVDAQDAREITDYMPFRDPRTIVLYVMPEMKSSIAQVRHMYPDAEVKRFYDNLGRFVFTRLVIPEPHAPAQ
jgi:Dolichyl-phosphate-mannose-protein mannosyltransferase